VSHVLVVGAGLAGLSCAHHLAREGHEVEVLEAAPRSGGQVRSERRDGVLLERGARWFQRTPVVDEILKEAGLQDEVVTVPNHPRVWRPTGLSPGHEGAFPPPGEPAGVGFEDRVTLVRGSGALPRALAEPVTVRLGWPVEAVEADALGVRVRFVAPSGERSVRAEAAVLAVPRRTASALSREVAPATGGATRAIVVHLVLPGLRLRGEEVRVAPDAGFDAAGWTVTAGESASAVRIPLRAEAVSRWFDAPKDALAAHLVEELARTTLGRLCPGWVRVDRFVLPAPEAPEAPVPGRRVLFAGGAGSVADALARGRRAARAVASLS